MDCSSLVLGFALCLVHGAAVCCVGCGWRWPGSFHGGVDVRLLYQGTASDAERVISLVVAFRISRWIHVTRAARSQPEKLIAYAQVLFCVWLVSGAHLGRLLEVVALPCLQFLGGVDIHLCLPLVLRCFHMGGGPQSLLADPFDVERGRVLDGRAGDALRVQLIGRVACFQARLDRVKELLLEKLPLRLALLQEVLDRVLPPVLGFVGGAHVLVVSPLAQLLRIGHGIRVLVCLSIALLLGNLLLHSAWEQHASRLRHQLL